MCLVMTDHAGWKPDLVTGIAASFKTGYPAALFGVPGPYLDDRQLQTKDRAAHLSLDQATEAAKPASQACRI
jgi:hypothetical protein